jgi:hypothetical protein
MMRLALRAVPGSTLPCREGQRNEPNRRQIVPAAYIGT